MLEQKGPEIHLIRTVADDLARARETGSYDKRKSLGRLPRPHRPVYSGGPVSSTFAPFFSSVLVSILPTRISCAVLLMMGSMPMLAKATTVSPRHWACSADQKTGVKNCGGRLGLTMWLATVRPAFWATFQCSMRVNLPPPPGPWYG
ncbi:hypothetical protein VTK73DRAFT_1732 [Phialemonium thermophilum]|uniref:Uncharacterized protein n=1 Tax=Phialemonium thermophilum TaxID=223376 RepID=A0ABR3VT22_9PEZI